MTSPSLVYLHTSPSGKQYVGWTSGTMEGRWAEHVRDALAGKEGCFRDAIRKYGPEAFESDVLGAFDTHEEGLTYEREMIAAMGTLRPNGYNVSEGGVGDWGAEWRASVREAWSDPELLARRRALSETAESRASKAARSTSALNPGLDAAALYKAALNRRSQNGILEPLPGSTIAKVWAICSRLKAELGREPKLGEVVKAAASEGIGDTARPSFRSWRRFHSTKLPRPQLGRVASICVAIMDREGREVRQAEFKREAQAGGLSAAIAAFYDFRNWWRAADKEQRAAFRVELAAKEAAGPGPVARIHAACDAILAETGREPTPAELRRLLPDIPQGTIGGRLFDWRKAHREAAAAKLAVE